MKKITSKDLFTILNKNYKNYEELDTAKLKRLKKIIISELDEVHQSSDIITTLEYLACLLKISKLLD